MVGGLLFPQTTLLPRLPRVAPPKHIMERPTRPKIAAIDVSLLEIRPVSTRIRRISGSQANLANTARQRAREHLASSGPQDLEGFVPPASDTDHRNWNPEGYVRLTVASWMPSMSETRCFEIDDRCLICRQSSRGELEEGPRHTSTRPLSERPPISGRETTH